MGCMVQAGLKTGMYYLRTRAAADAIKFTVDQQALARSKAARTVSVPAADYVLKVRPTKDPLPINSTPGVCPVLAHQRRHRAAS